MPTYIKSGCVLKAEDDKNFVQSQPLTTGSKAVSGIGVVFVAGGAEYEILWGTGS